METNKKTPTSKPSTFPCLGNIERARRSWRHMPDNAPTFNKTSYEDVALLRRQVETFSDSRLVTVGNQACDALADRIGANHENVD